VQAPSKFRKLADVLDARENNFDILRLIAALGVMFGHSFWIQPAQGHPEPLLNYLGFEYSGSLSVYTFFFISGMLVTASYTRQRSAWTFLALRLARIYPALLACVLISAFVLYPALTSASKLHALTSAATVTYVIHTAGLFLTPIWTLPDLFEHNAIKGAMNLSLWTLALEAKCYLLVLVFGLSGLLKRWWLTLLGTAAAALIFAYLLHIHYGPARDQGFFIMPPGYSFYPTIFFLLGMAAYAARNRFYCHGTLAATSIGVFMLLRETRACQASLYVALCCSILWFVSTPLLSRIKLKADLSYGIYLWAFPVQQVVESIFPNVDNYLGLTISIPICVTLAALSWFAIEKPAMKLARAYLKPKDAAAVRIRFQPEAQSSSRPTSMPPHSDSARADSRPAQDRGEASG
jgi:peptidoglycan/LPS O-acetylase OafA/YrhL